MYSSRWDPRVSVIMFSAWCFRKILTDIEVARREGDCNSKVVPTGFLPASYEFGGARKYCVHLDFWDRDDLGVFKIYQVSGDHG